MAIVLGAGLLVGLLGNALHPRGVSLSRPVRSLAEPGQCAPPSVGPAEPGRPPVQPIVLSPQEARLLRSQPGVVFGDLRPPEQYARGHIAGAMHLPCNGPLGQRAFARLAAGTRLVLYDEDGRSPELATAAATALMRGMGEVYVLQGGFSGWLAAGLAAESGACNDCGPL